MKSDDTERLARRRVPVVFICVISFVFFLLYTGALEVSVNLKVSPPNAVDTPRLRWDEEFDLVQNFKDWSQSKRGERFFLLTFFSFLFNWAVHFITRRIFKLSMSSERYYGLSVRDRFFLAQR